MLTKSVMHLLLFPLLFTALFVVHPNSGDDTLSFDCYVWQNQQSESSACPPGLRWFDSVQLCCAPVDNYRLSPGDGIFYQQRYASRPEFAPNDSVPKGCIRAMHFPNESLVYCAAASAAGPTPPPPPPPSLFPPSSSHGPSSADNGQTQRHHHFALRIVTIPVRDSVAQNIYCCSPSAPQLAGGANGGIIIKRQNVYHGTVAAKRDDALPMGKRGAKVVSVRAACNAATTATGDGFNHPDAKCADTSDVYDYNRQCCVPKSDTNLTTAGEYHAEIKIRTSYNKDRIEHVNVSVGDYEYDYTSLGPRRRTFNRSKDALLPADEGSAIKAAKSFKMPIFASTKRADKLFWEMSRRNFLQLPIDFEWGVGWDNGYDKYEHNCVDFVYEFVCNLFDGKCPQKDIWPENFVQIDRELNHSRAFRTNQTQLYGKYNCSMERHELRIEYAIDKHGVDGTPVVDYDTGVAVSDDSSGMIRSIRDVVLVQKIRNQQKCHVESMNSDGTRVVCKALLDVCSPKFVLGLAILDSKLKRKLKSTFREEVDYILDLDELKYVIQL